MEGKLSTLKQKLDEKMRGKAPINKDFQSQNGNGFTSGKQSESVISKTSIVNQFTGRDILPEDERLDQTYILEKIQRKNKTQDKLNHILRQNKQKYGHDTDRLYMGQDDMASTGDEIALSRNSFFKDLNKFNVISKNGRNISPLEQAILYK